VKGGEKMPQDMNKGQGRGWFGDTEGHAKAGRKGGRARGKARKDKRSNLTDEDRNRGELESQDEYM